MNKPYVKEFNKNGELNNPIKGLYLNEFPNRRMRRFKIIPNSTKIARCSDDNCTVIRTNKYLKQTENN
jgi:hypothetical protein